LRRQRRGARPGRSQVAEPSSMARGEVERAAGRGWRPMVGRITTKGVGDAEDGGGSNLRQRAIGDSTATITEKASLWRAHAADPILDMPLWPSRQPALGGRRVEQEESEDPGIHSKRLEAQRRDDKQAAKYNRSCYAPEQGLVLASGADAEALKQDHEDKKVYRCEGGLRWCSRRQTRGWLVAFGSRPIQAGEDGAWHREQRGRRAMQCLYVPGSRRWPGRTNRPPQTAPPPREPYHQTQEDARDYSWMLQQRAG